jgi:prophage regulatory protein
MLTTSLNSSTFIINQRGTNMKFLKLQSVMAITGLSRSSIYLAINQGNFPLQIPLGVRSVVWDEREIITWMESRIALRKAA